MIAPDGKLPQYPGDENALWNVEDLARRWKCSVSGIHAKIRRDAIPSLKIGRLLRFDPQQIRQYELRQQQ